MNVDAKLMSLAKEHKNAARSKHARLIRGRAAALIAKAYPLNFDAIWDEWKRLSACPVCQNDGKIMVSTGNPKHPLQAIDCPHEPTN